MRALAIILALIQLLCSCTKAITVYSSDATTEFNLDGINQDKRLRVRLKDGRIISMKFSHFDGKAVHGYIHHEVQSGTILTNTRIDIAEIERIKKFEISASRTIWAAVGIIFVIGVAFSLSSFPTFPQ